MSPPVLDIRSEEFHRDPYPAFRNMRCEAPVCRVHPHGHWAISRFSDVARILRTPSLFSSAGMGEEPAAGPKIMARSRAMIGKDPPEHARLRTLVNLAFTPTRVARLESRVRKIAGNLMRELEDRSGFDWIEDFASPFPLMVIAELLGIEPGLYRDFRRWTQTLLTWRAEPGRDLDGVCEEMFDYFNAAISRCRHSPDDGLVSALVGACDSGQRLTPPEVLSFIRLLLVAGSETTTNLLGNGLIALMAHPGQWWRVREDRALIPGLVEESLRYDGPVLSLIRKVTADTEIAGTSIAAGEMVLPLIASANRDEARFEAPDRFDVGRDARGHLGFGEGIHFCLGSSLARLQVRVSWEECFRRFESLESVSSQPFERIDSFFFRGVRRLPVVTRASEF